VAIEVPYFRDVWHLLEISWSQIRRYNFFFPKFMYDFGYNLLNFCHHVATCLQYKNKNTFTTNHMLNSYDLQQKLKNKITIFGNTSVECWSQVLTTASFNS
jgi:hypothetical protein